MFTGLIEEIGQIKEIKAIPGGVRLKVQADKIFSDLKIDDSVNINGACQTVVKIDKPFFWVESVGDTLLKTTFKEFKVNRKVNLERALTLNSRLGGHLVQGHVNGVGTVLSVVQNGDNWFFTVKIPEELAKYCVEEGSIAIDGISLTIAEKEGNVIRLSIISHTYHHTIMQDLKPGNHVNIEVDIIAKYVESIFTKKGNKSLSIDDLKQWGY
ncbi:MAG: riboflavin synthase [Calditrichia bacterium]